MEGSADSMPCGPDCPPCLPPDLAGPMVWVCRLVAGSAKVAEQGINRWDTILWELEDVS